jgi:hypothetical protein
VISGFDTNVSSGFIQARTECLLQLEEITNRGFEPKQSVVETMNVCDTQRDSSGGVRFIFGAEYEISPSPQLRISFTIHVVIACSINA